MYPFQTDIRGMAIYTVPKIDVQLSGTMQSRPGPEILAQWNVPANVIAQSLGRPPSGGVANIQTNILTAGELYGDRITQVDMRIAKLLRFGRTRANVGIDIYNLFNSNVPLTYVNDVRHDVGESAVSARCALREDQRADRFLNDEETPRTQRPTPKELGCFGVGNWKLGIGSCRDRDLGVSISARRR